MLWNVHTAQHEISGGNMIRNPSVANQFYEGDPTRLRYELGRLIGPVKSAEPAFALIAPHAGYIYSGAIAGRAYAAVRVPETVVIMGPNHTGLGAPAALWSKGAWEMPLGTVPVDEELSSLINKGSGYLTEDIQAHLYEHSLEVQIPFLQYRQPNLRIVPICLGHLPYPACHEIGMALAQAIKSLSRPVLIVASSDMTHYEPQYEAEAKDRLAIAQVLAMDPQGLFDTVRSHGITMCGIIPATVALVASSALGASDARLVAYGTSGDVTGDYNKVVGYASFVIS